MLLSEPIPTLINGVSQQPAALRLPSQGDEQVNFLSSVVDGLKKRPPTQHIAKLSSSSLGQAFIHTINRDPSERYAVIIQSGSIRVFELNGTERSVSKPNGTNYLNATQASTAFRAVTIADSTFIVNSEISTSMDSASASVDRGAEAIVFIKQANYSTDYNIILDGFTASKTTDADDQNETLSTTTIASDLKSSLDAGTNGFLITQEGPVLWIRKSDSSDFSIKTEDSRSNTQMSLAKNRVQNFSDLPTIAPTGFTVEVIGDEASTFDNYFVKFVPNNDGETFDTGTWAETVKPGIATRFASWTMPHVLVRESNGTFTFRRLQWDPREAGDEDSAPVPSFLGRTINDIFFFQNRLSFLSDENMIMSATGEFYKFFPSTVTTIIDSDSVDIAATHVKVSILRHAVPFNEQLILFSDQTQFVVQAGDILASQPPSAQVLTEFESSLRAKPVGAGRNVFFATKKGQYSGVREYFILPDTETEDAADITAHVPKYIPQDLFKFAAASNEDILLALSEKAANRIYVYKYYWVETEKLQSSWSYWELNENANIRNIDFIDTDAIMIVEYPDGVYLEKLSVEPGRSDPEAPFEYHLDRKIDETVVSSVYNSSTDQTTFSLPYSVFGTAQVVRRHSSSAPANAPSPGVVLQITSVSGADVTVSGDHTATPVFIGISYEGRYEFSELYLRTSTGGGGQTAVGDGRLQILNMSVTYDSTGFFTAKVTPQARNTYEYKFTGRILGATSAVIGEVPIESGTYRFPIMGRNTHVKIELTNDSYLPCAFQSAEWEARFTMRSVRRGL